MIKLCAFADEASSEVLGQIDALRQNGIQLLEVRGVDGASIADISMEQTKRLKSTLDDNGISVWSIGSPIGKHSLDADFAPHLELFEQILEKAQILGANRIRMFSFFPAEGQEERATRDAAFERLHRLCERTPKGITLCHENEKNIYGESIEHCLAIHRTFPSIRAVFDPANFVQCGVDTLTAWESLCPYVDYIHIKDARADGYVVPAGNGDGNVKEIISRYLSQGGEVMTLEPHLMDFVGLAGLENGESVKQDITLYRNNREAFDTAATALRSILSTINT